ncbi:MAG: ribosome silencing factor [Gammaproteobacteria bacterium]
MEIENLQQLVVAALGDLKAQDIRVIDVRDKTPITDLMVIASGTSDRHVKALADSVIARAKQAGVQPLGIEGAREAEWVLVDLNDIIVHVMLPRVRDFYNLERLWMMDEPMESRARS